MTERDPRKSARERFTRARAKADRDKIQSPVGHSLSVLQQRFTRFMNGTGRLLWINSPLARIYVRKSVRFVGGKKVECLDLASMSVVEKFQKHGIMTRFSEFMETFGHPVYAESILIPEVLSSFLRRGYEHYAGHPNCVIKFVTRSEPLEDKAA